MKTRYLIGGVALSLTITGCGVGVKSRPSDPESHPTSVFEPSIKVSRVPTYKDGDYIVGKDIIAGRYFTAGPYDQYTKICVWQTRSVDGKTFLDGGANSGQQYATLKDGTLFTTQGCQPWIMAA
jgi:hypothetical protein